MALEAGKGTGPVRKLSWIGQTGLTSVQYRYDRFQHTL
jgi:hypothetical protein